MKIKKKEYQKQLDDRFWKGVNAGMKFALNNPEEAKKYIDRTEALKIIVERTSKAFEALTNAINKLFGGEK